VGKGLGSERGRVGLVLLLLLLRAPVIAMQISFANSSRMAFLRVSRRNWVMREPRGRACSKQDEVCDGRKAVVCWVDVAPLLSVGLVKRGAGAMVCVCRDRA